jgi:hypothetical protein
VLCHEGGDMKIMQAVAGYHLSLFSPDNHSSRSASKRLYKASRWATFTLGGPVLKLGSVRVSIFEFPVSSLE